MIMPANHVSHNYRYCQSCGEKIEKRKKVSWPAYSRRKYCNNKECLKAATTKGGSVIAGDNGFDPSSRDEMPISDYIGVNSKNGRLMADFNLGVLQAVEKVGHDAELSENARGVICTYKGVPVTGDVVKTANQWLMDNWMGKAGQRNAPPEVDNRTSDEKMRELEYIVKELGFRLVKIDE